MSQQSNIEWCDATWNPVRGCTKVSPGCAHCYAETFAERFRGVHGHPYEQGFDLRLAPNKLTEPLSWKKPRRVFVNSMSDLFHESVPTSYIDGVFAVMALAPEHTFQILTKRPDRMLAYLSASDRHDAIVATMDMPSWLPVGRSFLRVPEGWPLPNVWLGVSIENQHFADERLPLLFQTPAAVRFISAEPLLGSISLHPPAPTGLKILSRYYTKTAFDPTSSQPEMIRDRSKIWNLDWVIVGGESGPGARPFEVAWARSIVGECLAGKIPVFVKQLGANVVDRNDAGFEGDTSTSWPMDTYYKEDLSGFRDGYQGAPVRVLLRKKGGDMAEWPEDLRVREFPRV